MEPLKKVEGVVAAIDRSNIDTDQIIPKQFLKKIERTGFGVHLFHDWRYLDESGENIDPQFILNRAPFDQAVVLLSRENFGCGSSREHAPWALADFGFRVIIAPSFADIFYNNCFKNGMLPVIFDESLIDELFAYIGSADHSARPELSIDLESCEVKRRDGVSYRFEVDAFRRECLLNGWDDIGLTLRQDEKIRAFVTDYRENFPFYFSAIEATH